MTSRLTFAAAAMAALTAATPLAAFDVADMSAAEREAFRAEVRAYLMDNPEVLLEAINVLEERQAQEQAASDETLVQVNADAIFRDGHSWVGGNPDGDITVVEFLDYRCSYCRRAHPEVAELIQTDGNIRFIVKEFPILGDNSMLASRFAIAVLNVAGPEAYSQVSDALMEYRGTISEASLRGLAERLLLDADAVMAAMDDPEVGRVIAKNRALARKLEINGTPSFVFGDQLLRGYAPLDAMRSVVAELRAE